MKSTIAGVLLAVAFIAALFAANRYLPRANLGVPPEKVAASVERGFVGVKQIGAWQLVCLASPTVMGAPAKTPPLPLNLHSKASGADPATAPASAQPPAQSKQISLGRCRATLAYASRKNPKRPAFLVNLRFIGAKERLTMIVRTPPMVKKGDALVLRTPSAGMKIPVVNCGKTGCAAIAVLNVQAQSQLLTAKEAALLFPATANGAKRPTLPLRMRGLDAAITAMQRAES